MKKNLIALIAGAISLAALIPLSSVLAQSQSSNTPTAPSTYGQGGYRQLTADQKAQLKQLRQSTLQQIQAILTPDQQAQYQSAIAQGKKPKDILMGLNLSPDQQTQIQQIRKTARTQMQAIAPNLGHHGGKFRNLTDVQKSQLMAIRQSTQQQIDAVLTDEQRSQLQSAMAQGTKRRDAIKGLNLTADQQAQIKQIRQNAKAQIQGLLKVPS